MVILKEPMEWKEEDGTKYKISYSEKLQIEQLNATKDLARWHKRNFYVKIALLAVGIFFTMMILYVFSWLNRVDFFTKMLISQGF